MPRKSSRQEGNRSPIDIRQQELDRRAEEIKAKLNKTQNFLQKAPDLIAEVQRKQQRAIVDRYERPARIEGPGDFRIDFVNPRNSAPPPRLRKERSKAPLVTILLVVAFAIVIYYAFRVLWHE